MCDSFGISDCLVTSMISVEEKNAINLYHAMWINSRRAHSWYT